MTNDFLPKPLVTAEWLLKHREQVLLFDCRFSLTDNQAGIEAYRAGHVPGAIFADLAQHLSSIAQESGTGGRHPAPSTNLAPAAAHRRFYVRQASATARCYRSRRGTGSGTALER